MAIHPPASAQILVPQCWGAGTKTFDYNKDYADGAQHKPMQLAVVEFTRRLQLHCLSALRLGGVVFAPRRAAAARPPHAASERFLMGHSRPPRPARLTFKLAAPTGQM